MRRASVPREDRRPNYYVDQKPWYDLGTDVREEVTSAEAIRKAHLNWRVVKQPLSVTFKRHGKDRQRINFEGQFITQRMDNGQPLGVVKSRYKVLQNQDAFSFFDTIVSDQAAAYYSAGSLGRGERVWLMVKLPGHIVVKSVDKVEKFLLLTNSHDGHTSLTMKLMPIRVACQSTLMAALKDGRDAARLRHTTNMSTLRSIRKQVGATGELFKKLGEQWEFLASRPCGIQAMQSYARHLLTSLAKGDVAAERTKAAAIIEDACERFERGRGATQEEIRGTWWAAYNAIAEHVDWSPLWSRARTADARTQSLLLGRGAHVKEAALLEALERAKKY